MKWDHGVRNSYRMGAEGKYDLKLANCDNLPLLEGGCSSSNTLVPASASKKLEKSNVLVNRKSSSTPSLPEATESQMNKSSVASTEQASSADNLTWKQAVETIAENVLSSAKSDIVSGTDARNTTNQTEVSVVVHALRELENHQDLSLINHTPAPGPPPMSDLATITENYTLNNDNIKNNATTSNTFLRQQSYSDDSKVSNIEANNKMNASNSVNSISKSLLGNLRGCSGPRVSQISTEALDVIDKMREGVDMIRNNTNNIISSEILQIPSATMHSASAGVKIPGQKNPDASGATSDTDKYRNKMKPIQVIQQSKRQILPVEEACSSPQSPPCSVGAIALTKDRDNTNNSKNNIIITPAVIESQPSQAPAVSSAAASLASGGASDGLIANNAAVSSSMSVSVPNLTTSSNSEASNQIEPVSPPGLLETFAALALRRTSQGSSFQTNNQVISNSSNMSNNQQAGSFFPRGQNSVSSLVKLALSSNFHTGLLSTAQSYPSLTSTATSASSNILNSGPGVATTAGNQITSINPTLTMSLTSTSSDSEQVSFEDFLESCRAPTLLGELEDEEDMDDDNDDEENEDEYEEVGVSNIKKYYYFLISIA